MPDITIQPAERVFSASITPPASKSLTNRALVLAAMGDGASRLRNVLIADDTRVMIDGLKKLGFELEIDEPGETVTVHGMGGKIPSSSAELFCGNSGTTIRFLTALCALGRGKYHLDGIERMRQRPIGELVQLLKDMGVRCDYPGMIGYPPVQVNADGVPGGLIRFGAAQSSQFISAALMIGPYARHELKVDLIGPQTSWPYVAMTMQLMDTFGITPELIREPSTGEPKQIIIPQGTYSATDYVIEPDASNAAYFIAAAAIHEGAEVTIRGLGRQSLQGDIGFAEVLRRMGAGVAVRRDSLTVTGSGRLNGIDVDLAPMPDTAQTLAAISLFAEGKTVIRGLRTLRVKETDRLEALSNELTRLGANIKIDVDVLWIEPPKEIQPAAIQTYDDHRMAMSFALVATKAPGIVIKDCQCVNKTYPNYFEDLNKVLESKPQASSGGGANSP
jgi:3-phosphoshikimate 1-carboxyvinyltransferase